MSNKKILLKLFFCFFFIQVAPSKHFHAYKVSAAGANVVVDPTTARYQECNVDVLLSSNLFMLGQQSYYICRIQKIDDSVTTFFCYHFRGQDSIFCSVTIMPAQGRNHWFLLTAWEDSTKAYKAITVLK